MADFSEEQIQKVWNKGNIISGYDSSKYRQDVADAWMQRDQYGEKGTLGWTIDHAYPETLGGDENLINLRPMQWQNNQSKSDSYPVYTATITSEGKNNIEKERSIEVDKGLQKQLKQLYKIK